MRTGESDGGYWVDDDGTAKKCIKNGHCGCDENQLKNEFENHVPMRTH